MRHLVLGLVIVSLGATAFGEEVTAKRWKRVLDDVLPSKAQCRWEAVAWRPTLWDAVVEANAEDKPILLWAMNGHALACT